MVLIMLCPVSERTKVVVIKGDITDYSSVSKASRGVDVLIHTASLVDVWHKVPESVIFAVNVKGMTRQGSGGKWGAGNRIGRFSESFTAEEVHTSFQGNLTRILINAPCFLVPSSKWG